VKDVKRWVKRISVNTAIEGLRRNNVKFSDSEGFEQTILDKQSYT
jgi:RNA polymerase sigma-70 factor (ECF subfamily)